MAQGKGNGDGTEQAVETAASGLGAVEKVQLSTDQLITVSSLQPRVEDETLREISSYEEALRVAAEVNGVLKDISEEIGTGFALLEDKGKLEKSEFVMLTWRFWEGDFGPVVTAALVTTSGDKYIINDGSTGIYDQLREFSTQTRLFGGMRVPRGLRVSDYSTCPECERPMSRDETECSKCGYSGEDRHRSKTWYLDTSPAAK